MIKLNLQQPNTPTSALTATTAVSTRSIGAHEQPQFLRVSRINFLIHPLFGSDRREDFNGKHAMLSDLYQDAAHQMSPDEILCVFLPYEFSDIGIMPDSCCALFMHLLTSLQVALGRRLCTFDSTVAIQDPPHRLGQVLLPYLKKKRFTLPGDVASTAFGETLKLCVLQGAANFRLALGLNKPTSLMPYYSDEHYTTSFEGERIFNEDVLSRGGFKLVMGPKL